MILPLDIANSRLDPLNQLNIELLQNIVYIMFYITLGFVTPYLIFLYETDDE